jgi:hypothetical protein
MEAEISPIQKLDTVLKIIAVKYPTGVGEQYFYKTLRSVFDEVKKLIPNAELSELVMILNKLIKDEYAEMMKETAFGTIDEKEYYSITFEGKLFLQQGGYQIKEIEDKNNRMRMDELEKRQNQNEQRLIKLNRWVAIGSVGAAVGSIGILIWEMRYWLAHLF